MKKADYKCQSCGGIQEISVLTMTAFPEEFPCNNCKGGVCRRIFSAIPAIVMQGRAGNSKTGYASNPGYIKKT